MVAPRQARKGGGNTKFDPVKKTGLLPSAPKGPRGDGSGATYVMSGSVVAPHDAQYVSQRQKKDAEAKERRTKEAREAKEEEMLKKLLKNDNGTAGARAVQSARDYLKQEKRKADGKGKGRADSEEEEEDKDAEEREKRKRAIYGPEMLKKLGYDPTLRPGDAPKTKKVHRTPFSCYSADLSPDRSISQASLNGTKLETLILVLDQVRASSRVWLYPKGRSSNLKPSYRRRQTKTPPATPFLMKKL